MEGWSSLTNRSHIDFLTFVQIYCVFGTFCTVAAIHVFLLFPETCGKSLEEIDEIFSNHSIWAFKTEHVPSRLAADIEQAKEDLTNDKVGVDYPVLLK